MILNNYWFLLCRTLMNERIWWVMLPILVYGIIAAGLFIPEDSPLFDWSIDLGEGFILGHLLTFIGVSATIVALWFINRELMIKLIYNEINKVEDTRVKHVSEYKFLDRVRPRAQAARAPTISPTTGSQTMTPRNVGGNGAEPMGSRVKKPRAARSIVISCLCLATCSFP
mgnify:CR=1 FL=1